jgi:hypothetical protein
VISTHDTSDLEDALAMFQNTEHITEFDVKNCSWRDVLDQMHEAQDVYNAKGEKNKARGLFRHGKAISENLTPLLALIPDQYGLNILRGGLALIFKVCVTRLDAEILSDIGRPCKNEKRIERRFFGPSKISQA